MRLTPDKHLHSREHVLADDLSRMLLEPKRFVAYLGIAKMYEESDLRALAKYALGKRDLEPKNRGRYFFGALKNLPKSRAWIRELRRRARRQKRLQSGHGAVVQKERSLKYYNYASTRHGKRAKK